MHMSKELFNKPEQTQKRRALRRDAPPAETLFWREVRDRRLGGYKFRRQFSIRHYVADFCCPECYLIVELDGASHEGDDAAEYDRNRQNYLESLGFLVVRSTNEQIYKEMPSVLETVLRLCWERTPDIPTPRPARERVSPKATGEGTGA